LYPWSWKVIPVLSIYVRYFVPLWLENHTLLIHLREIFCTPSVGKSSLNCTPAVVKSSLNCTFAVGKSSSKAGDRSNEFHE
jgi:hypothetical protein